jgi:GT2 family glycosyltransferase
LKRATEGISCSIVCYHDQPDRLARLLACITMARTQPLVYVLDNSPHDMLGPVAQRFGAQYIHQPHNPGSARSHNLALRAAAQAGSAYHVVLAPDVLFPFGAIGKLVAAMARQPDIGLLAPAVRRHDGRPQRLGYLLPHPLRLLPGRDLASRRLMWYQAQTAGGGRLLDVPALSGPLLVMRVETVLRVGLFDERFFLYFEDVDLARRVGREARTVLLPELFVMHDHAIDHVRDGRLRIHRLVSAIRYFNKWGWFDDRERDLLNVWALRKAQLVYGHARKDSAGARSHAEHDDTTQY